MRTVRRLLAVRRRLVASAVMVGFLTAFLFPGAIPEAHAAGPSCYFADNQIRNTLTGWYGDISAYAIVICSGALEINVTISVQPTDTLVGTPGYGVGSTGLVPFTCTLQSWCLAGTWNFVIDAHSSGHCWQDNVNAVATGVGGVTSIYTKGYACF
jgi:hypothetical protein